VARKSSENLSALIVFQRSHIHSTSEGDSLGGSDTLSWSPPVDIYETDDSFVVTVEIPGVERNDVRVEVSGSELSISGNRGFDAVCSKESYHRLEGVRGRFRRSFSLPEPLDSARVTANLKDGVLRVVLPKTSRRLVAGAGEG
jgi:HSP20 family protein